MVNQEEIIHSLPLLVTEKEEQATSIFCCPSGWQEAPSLGSQGGRAYHLSSLQPAGWWFLTPTLPSCPLSRQKEEDLSQHWSALDHGLGACIGVFGGQGTPCQVFLFHSGRDKKYIRAVCGLYKCGFNNSQMENTFLKVCVVKMPRYFFLS